MHYIRVECGLPVIVSAANGTSEIVTHEWGGLILEGATDAPGLGRMIRRLCQEESFRARLCENARKTGSSTRERTILENVLRNSQHGMAQSGTRNMSDLSARLC